MAFIVIYDANVLYPNTLRDLLIRIAQLPHIVQAKWTDEILDEMLEALRKNLPDISEEKASRLRELVNAAVRDCLVLGYEPLIEVLDLPDPDDRHVLAAAIKVNAQLIVTRDRKDFPAGEAGSVGYQGKITRRLRSRRDGHRLPGRLGVRPADRGFTYQTAGDGRGRTRRAGARRPGGLRGCHANEVTRLPLYSFVFGQRREA